MSGSGKYQTGAGVTRRKATKNVPELTFYFLFSAYPSSPFVRCSNFFHMMESLPCSLILRTTTRLFLPPPKKKYNVRDSPVCCVRRLTRRVRVRARVPIPLRLRCLFHSTGTPTLSRYIVDIRPLTSP